MTASDFLGQNTCTKDRSFLWQRIKSASKIDTDRCHKLLGARLEWGPILWAPYWDFGLPFELALLAQGK